MNYIKRPDLLPRIEVLPNDADYAKNDSRQPGYMMANA
jgi:hypothetical protein